MKNIYVNEIDFSKTEVEIDDNAWKIALDLNKLHKKSIGVSFNKDGVPFVGIDLSNNRVDREIGKNLYHVIINKYDTNYNIKS